MPTEAQLTALEAAALSWVGTPFCANSGIKGAGVCCHRLISEIYFEAGWLPRFDVPSGPPHGGRAGSTPEMENFLDACPHFADADPQRLCQTDWRRAIAECIQPGHLVLSVPARLPWHLVLALTRGRWVHAVWGGSVQIPLQLPDVWASRMWRIYAPVLTA